MHRFVVLLCFGLAFFSGLAFVFGLGLGLRLVLAFALGLGLGVSGSMQWLANRRNDEKRVKRQSK